MTSYYKPAQFLADPLAYLAHYHPTPPEDWAKLVQENAVALNLLSKKDAQGVGLGLLAFRQPYAAFQAFSNIQGARDTFSEKDDKGRGSWFYALTSLSLWESGNSKEGRRVVDHLKRSAPDPRCSRGRGLLLQLLGDDVNYAVVGHPQHFADRGRQDWWPSLSKGSPSLLQSWWGGPEADQRIAAHRVLDIILSRPQNGVSQQLSAGFRYPALESILGTLEHTAVSCFREDPAFAEGLLPEWRAALALAVWFEQHETLEPCDLRGKDWPVLPLLNAWSSDLAFLLSQHDRQLLRKELDGVGIQVGGARFPAWASWMQQALAAADATDLNGHMTRVSLSARSSRPRL